MPASELAKLNSYSYETREQEQLRLTPRLTGLVKAFLEERNLVKDLVNGLGSPLNILFPQSLRDNVEGLNAIFEENGIIGRIFFAHKCNQSDSLTRQLSVERCGIDVSSVKELQHALGSGFVADRIEITGPKTRELLFLGIQHGVWINIDSLPELDQLIELSSTLVAVPEVRILLRLAGFRSEHSRFLNKGSRFGISLDEVEQAFDRLEQAPQIHLAGFSFHLDTVSVLERTVAVENCIEVLENALSRGFCPNVLDIGGGYKVNYLAEEDDWNCYTSALKESVLGTRKAITWHGNAFGMHSEKGVLKGNFNSYTYYDEQTGARFLTELLSQKLPTLENATVASVLRDNMIELWIEPGRALLDQCGITLGRVNSIRSASNGEALVNLSMKRQDVCFLDQEIFVDPIVIPCDSERRGAPAAVYFAGNLCLESDLVYRHKTYLPFTPTPGDIVAFINTAGYFMDFSATNSIMQPIARKAAVTHDGTQFQWCLDDCFWPTNKR